MASATRGRWPLLAGRRFAKAAIPRPNGSHDGEAVSRAVGDYLFGLDAQPAAADLATNRIPDAQGGFRWVISWRTDIPGGGNYDGTEQRIATLTEPRHRFDGSFFADDADLRHLRRLLSQSPAGEYELPLPHEAVSAILAITGGTIYVTPTYCDWLAVGRRIYVRGAAGAAYTTTITGISGGTVNVSSSPPAGGRFPAIHTLIFPIETVRLEPDQGLSRYPVNVGRWNFTARAAARSAGGAGATLTRYDGWTVLDRRPLQQREAPETILGGVEFLDNDATMTSLTSWTRSAHRRTGDWFIDNPAARQWVKAFVAERRGKYKPCLWPTWRPDLTLYEQPTAGTNTIRVTDDYLGQWWPSLAHRRLQLERAGSAVQYVTVDSVTQGVGYQELLLRDDVAAVPIAKVSFLETVRLDTDQVQIEYGTGWKGRVSLPLVTVQETLESVEWPSTAAAMRTAIGGWGVWDCAWPGSVSTPGVIPPRFGPNTLTAGGTPLYTKAGPIPSRFALAFDSSTDRFEAASSSIYNLGAATSLAIYVCFKIEPGSDGYILGKVGTSYYLFRNHDPDDTLSLQVFDGVSFAWTGTLNFSHSVGWHDALLFIDRDGANDYLQLVTDLGSTAPADITGVGSLSNSAPFSLGHSSATPPHRNAFTAVCTGEVSTLRANAVAAIAAIRAYTGR